MSEGTGIDDPLDLFDPNLPPAPYPGLRPFKESEWPVFFGREIAIDAISSRIVTDHVVTVHGSSGSGKSSLVHAGVFIRLRQDHARYGLTWRTCGFRPGTAPLANLAKELAAMTVGPTSESYSEIRSLLNRGKNAGSALVELLRRNEKDYLCVLFDQFEELFRLASEQNRDEARLLVDVLTGMVMQPTDGLYAVVTMRSDFLGECARFAGLAEAINQTAYLLPPIDRPNLLRAITEPTRLYGGSVDTALADALIAEIEGEQDALPLVQHGLMRLWEEKGRPRTERLELTLPAPWCLTLSDKLDGSGRSRSLKRMLSDHADAVMKDLVRDAPERGSWLEQVFRALAEVNAQGHAVRRPQSLAELAAVAGTSPAKVMPLVNAFRADGVSFLTPYAERQPVLEESDTIDVSHEAVIRCWQAIADPKDGWLRREFEDGLTWRSLIFTARTAGAVLDTATTSQLWPWYETVSERPAWAKRYSLTSDSAEQKSEWERVRALMERSHERWMEQKKQLEVAQSRRLEAERRALNEQHAREQIAIEESDLASELAKGLKISSTQISVTSTAAHIPINEAEIDYARPPYVGLRSFELEDAPFFFGRDRLIQSLHHKLTKDRFVTLIGPSGSGKTSAVRAGMLPVLRQEPQPWRVALLRPSLDPMLALAHAVTDLLALDKVLDFDGAEVARTHLRLRRTNLSDLLEPVLREGPVLLVVECLEEVLQIQGPLQKAGGDPERFMYLLLQPNSQRHPSLRLIVTIRSDFLDDFQRLTGFSDILSQSQVLVPTPDNAELRAMIIRPLEIVRGTIEENVVDVLVEGFARGAGLPVLQHTLERTWQQASAADRPNHITMLDLEKVGGLDGALDRHAGEVFTQLSLDDREVAVRVFQALSYLIPHKVIIMQRPITFRQLVAEVGGQVERVRLVVESFRAAGMLTPPSLYSIDDTTLIDLSHSSLLERWTQGREWVEQEARDASYFMALAVEAKQDLTLPRSALLWWERRQPTPAWAQRYGVNLERLLLALRKARAQERRRRILVASAATLIVLLTMFSVLATYSWQLSERTRAAAEQQAAFLTEALSRAQDELKRATRTQSSSAKAVATTLLQSLYGSDMNEAFARVMQALRSTTDPFQAAVLVQSLASLPGGLGADQSRQVSIFLTAALKDARHTFAASAIGQAITALLPKLAVDDANTVITALGQALTPEQAQTVLGQIPSTVESTTNPNVKQIVKRAEDVLASMFNIRVYSCSNDIDSNEKSDNIAKSLKDNGTFGIVSRGDWANTNFASFFKYEIRVNSPAEVNLAQRMKCYLDRKYGSDFKILNVGSAPGAFISLVVLCTPSGKFPAPIPLQSAC